MVRILSVRKKLDNFKFWTEGATSSWSSERSTCPPKGFWAKNPSLLVFSLGEGSIIPKNPPTTKNREKVTYPFLISPIKQQTRWHLKLLTVRCCKLRHEPCTPSWRVKDGAVGGNQLIFRCFAFSLSRYSEDLEFDEAAACVFAKGGSQISSQRQVPDRFKHTPRTALPTDILMPAISSSKGVSLWLEMKRNKLSRDVKLNSGWW